MSLSAVPLNLIVVKENVIDMAIMDGQLLQKIEEITLYIIEQNKRIKKLESEISKLRED